ncbi:MAG TPA: DNA-3-methyladenine glycosylase [Mycobacteriales bacterium]|nr:DNA-3-methyladenine glycosylase [Mycobacteriales bacterium]
MIDLTGPVWEVAPGLLGALLVHGGVTLRLTEVEAYNGEADPASHAARGRTPRTEAMYGPPGRLYVYFVYGRHWCANIVTGPAGAASAVLLRAGEVVDGAELAGARRGDVPARELARGPARLARALGLTGADTGRPAVLQPAPTPLPHATGPRVGVGAGAETPWRFWLPGEPTVSSFRAGSRRSRPRGIDATGAR